KRCSRPGAGRSRCQGRRAPISSRWWAGRDARNGAALVSIEVGGLDFVVDDAGDGPAVLLLHGWPDSRRLWRDQLPALHAAGFRTIAPDLRGFGDSAKPTGVEAYALRLIVGDVVGIMDALGVASAHVVGHDWGAAVAWALAAFAPERVERLVALSVGHPGA